MQNKNNNDVFAIEMHQITKTFLNGKIVANKDVDLFVKRNEIHAIIGENGAGKSTLMSILFGIYKQDSGLIRINGETVNFSSAKDANKYGIGMVHQHFKLIDSLSVLDNIILGSEEAGIVNVIPRRSITRKLTNIISSYNFKLDLKKKVSNLTVGQQQKTEILKLLYKDIDILIFDEPTAVLSEDEIQSFLEMLLDFKRDGKTIVIITHKFNEIKQVADSATVIRRGQFIDRFDVKDKTIPEMAELMVGRKLVEIKNEDEYQPEGKKVVFKVENLNLFKQLKASSNDETKMLNFQIHEGEVFAIAGVEGNGQSQLALIIAGLASANSGAKIILNGVDITKFSIAKRYKYGLSHIPEDRHKHGLILDDTIMMNSVLQELNQPPYSHYGFLNNNKILEKAIDIINKYDVRGTVIGDNLARALSGGNQQKLIVGREIERKHDLIIMAQPTRGLDLGAIEFIHEQILREKQKNNAVLLISYELDEILSIADTIAVIHNGHFIGYGSSQEMTKQRIGELMAGEHNA
ncbi:ABC transporter ATP-binding protein [Ureaplasma miroungigenitalium]|uniref:ABC transporter ATP-binding protein n=1 Tax=Ureaplasma miroungigenitalium TaxID=1042321 RepID=A0ABT3BMS1_9BACT|nr:ABC transporter ATP-binding protein [Ureaplasma miroungigenitalium]MCV3728452.1 ABC transporter ATP-binding protein [Ureaplasma miroungigenitalium]MCV3734239.1 ABC transporter ATP-binding protein [Ureaplasma miroungigenitalium]